MIRARAGIGFALIEAMDDGHCGLPLDELVPMGCSVAAVDHRQPPRVQRTPRHCAQ